VIASTGIYTLAGWAGAARLGDALDRESRKAALSRFLKRASGGGLALQLLFCFEVRALGGGLVSSTPE